MNNVNYVDLVIFIILVVEIIKGIRRGVIVPLFDIAGLIFGWIIAKADAIKLAPFIDKDFHIMPFLTSKIATFVKLPEVIGSAPATGENLNAAFSTIHLPKFVQNFLLLNAHSGQSATVQQYMVNSISYSILIGISFMILFILILLIFRVVGVMVRKGIKVSPFLKWADAFFGAVFKFLVAFTALYIIAEVIVVSSGYLHMNNMGLIDQIEASKFYKIGVLVFPFLKTKIIQLITPLIK